MKNQNIKYLISVGIFLTITSMSFAQSSASHIVKIVVLRHNEMFLAENDQQKNANTYNLNWKSHNQGQKITVVTENNDSENNIKIIASDISGKTNHSEIPITAVPTNLISGNRSNKGNCQFRFMTKVNERKDKNIVQPTVMYTLTDT